MAQVTTSNLSGELITFLQKTFLDRAKNSIVFKEGAKTQSVPANSGKVMVFNRYTPLGNTVAGNTLTEGTPPTPQTISGAQVTATLVQLGNVAQISDFLQATSIDVQAKEKTDVLATQMVETIDNAIRDELFAGFTPLYANGRAALTAITSTDALTVKDILRVRRTLKKNGAPTYSDGLYIGKVGPDTAFDLFQDSTWVNVKTYSTPEDMYNGEIGKMNGVRFIEANMNQKNEASTVTVYSNFFHGQGAFATVDLENMQGGLYVHQGGKQDTYNPLEQFITIGWKTAFAAKTLNANWGINLKTAANA